MYANNSFSRRRPNGWAERRRHFERLFQQVATKAAKPDKDQRETSSPRKRAS